MKKVLIAILAVFGVLALAGIVAFGAVVLLALLAQPGVPSRTVLELDIQSGVIEVVPEDGMAQWLLDDQLEIAEIVGALERGSRDKNVRGLVARISAVPLGMAHIQEIRDAVTRFRESGKPAVAYSESFGEFGPGNGAYYLATAFDEIHLLPTGDVGLTGLMYETPFYRGALDKLEVEPEFGQRHEYKNAVNSYTETGYTEAHREAMQSLVDSQFDQMVRDVADARAIDEEDFRGFVDRGPLSAAEALEAGLVDQLSYRDQVWERIESLAGDRTQFLYVDSYLERAGAARGKGPTVALVHGYGTILRGPSFFSPLDGQIVMGSDSVGAALREALDDDDVKAIVFRVDSPGGSAIASDVIWRETMRAKKMGKPVIVSMGNLAASGGYFVSMAADQIVAQPGTITGSIGVYGGKLVTDGFWEKLGINHEAVSTSANSHIWSTHALYDDAGRERLDSMLDDIYEDFTSKVAEGRELELETVRSLAKGRIWTGEQALEAGLVDALGDIRTAMDLARQRLGLEADDPIRVKRYPEPRSAWDDLFGPKPDASQKAQGAALFRTLQEIQPAARMLRQLTSPPGPVPLLDERDFRIR